MYWVWSRGPGGGGKECWCAKEQLLLIVRPLTCHYPEGGMKSSSSESVVTWS